MATKIQIKRGSTPPSNGTLSEGELGFDRETNVLYIGTKNNTSHKVGDGLYLPLAGGTLTGSLNLILRTSAGIDDDAQANEPSLNWTTWGVASNKPYIGFATDQKDGTFVWSLKGTNYASGLAIGGTSGNLLWKETALGQTENNTTYIYADKDRAGNIITSTYLTKTGASNTYLPLTGGTITGSLTSTSSLISTANATGENRASGLILQPAVGGSAGGQIELRAAQDGPSYNGICLDAENGDFRIFGLAPANNPEAGFGQVLTIDPYKATINGEYYTITCQSLFVQDGDNKLAISPMLGQIMGNRDDGEPWEFNGNAATATIAAGLSGSVINNATTNIPGTDFTVQTALAIHTNNLTPGTYLYIATAGTHNSITNLNLSIRNTAPYDGSTRKTQSRASILGSSSTEYPSVQSFDIFTITEDQCTNGVCAVSTEVTLGNNDSRTGKYRIFTTIFKIG